MPEPPKFSYSLAEKPCVPVLDAQNKPQLLSLRDTLTQAHKLREIQHESPVVTASLLRLAVALLTDIYQIEYDSEWQTLWTRKFFDASVIDAYLKKYADRFDLFHEKYPFYQCAAIEDDNPINLNLLACEICSGRNNPTLFSHSLDTVEEDYSPVQAFHMLISSQNFALAGLLKRTTRLKGETEPLYWQSAYGGPLVPGAMVWLTGDNLFKTLCLNLTPLGEIEEEDDADETEGDRPIWRQDKPESLRDRQDKKGLVKIRPRGPRDRLTFQSRLIRLLPEWNEEKIVVRRAAFNHGRSLDATQGSFDPMLSYREGKKKEALLVVRLSAERAGWRDAHALIGVRQTEEGKVIKRISEALRTLPDHIGQVEGLDRNQPLSLHVAGLANDQAKILLWRHDRLDAPAQVLCDPDTAARVRSLLDNAESVAFVLWIVTRKICAIFLARLAEDATDKEIKDAMKADSDRVTDLANAIDTRPTYWARLESGFHILLSGLVEDEEEASNNWKKRIMREAYTAFNETIRSLGDDSAALKAAAIARPRFSFLLRQTSADEKRGKTSSPAKEDNTQ